MRGLGQSGMRKISSFGLIVVSSSFFILLAKIFGDQKKNLCAKLLWFTKMFLIVRLKKKNCCSFKHEKEAQQFHPTEACL